ncbi:hypothetical protein [Haloarcula argentinensis]|uniref:Uncharacterized protein n=1 Tax=Haloarcula argentinensis TaxID=43776 RepID=A0A847U4J9_HALAR|nr:hypothetical protein [Haloarcula argentinensis]NLV13212.1 hypothetical protein [Haloarcula argentinensis]
MGSDIEDKLRSATNEVKSNDADNSYSGSLIISKGGNSAEFIQFAANNESWTLDYPVIPSNDNTENKAQRIEKVVSEPVDAVGEGEYKSALQVNLDPGTDFVELSKELIESIWPKCDNIETEVVE